MPVTTPTVTSRGYRPLSRHSRTLADDGGELGDRGELGISPMMIMYIDPDTGNVVEPSAAAAMVDTVNATPTATAITEPVVALPLPLLGHAGTVDHVPTTATTSTSTTTTTTTPTTDRGRADRSVLRTRLRRLVERMQHQLQDRAAAAAVRTTRRTLEDSVDVSPWSSSLSSASRSSIVRDRARSLQRRPRWFDAASAPSSSLHIRGTRVPLQPQHPQTQPQTQDEVELIFAQDYDPPGHGLSALSRDHPWVADSFEPDDIALLDNIIDEQGLEGYAEQLNNNDDDDDNDDPHFSDLIRGAGVGGGNDDHQDNGNDGDGDGGDDEEPLLDMNGNPRRSPFALSPGEVTMDEYRERQQQEDDSIRARLARLRQMLDHHRHLRDDHDDDDMDADDHDPMEQDDNDNGNDNDNPYAIMNDAMIANHGNSLLPGQEEEITVEEEQVLLEGRRTWVRQELGMGKVAVLQLTGQPKRWTEHVGR